MNLHEKTDAILVQEELLSGMLQRASTLSFVLAAAYLLYGFTTIGFIQSFDPSVSLMDNVIPRIIFNTLPSACLGFILTHKAIDKKTRLWIWTVFSHLVFFAATLINVFPIMFKGQPSIYLYVHAANSFYTTLVYVWVSPFPRHLLFLVAGMILTNWIPSIFMFLKFDDFDTLSLLISDGPLLTAISILGEHLALKAREKTAKDSIIISRATETIRIAAEKEILRSQQIAQLEKEKNEALAIKGLQIHHDIRNPLETLRLKFEDLEKSKSDNFSILPEVNRIEEILNALAHHSEPQEIESQSIEELIKDIVIESQT